MVARCPFARCPRVFVDGDGRRASYILSVCVRRAPWARDRFGPRQSMLVGGVFVFVSVSTDANHAAFPLAVSRLRTSDTLSVSLPNATHMDMVCAVTPLRHQSGAPPPSFSAGVGVRYIYNENSEAAPNCAARTPSLLNSATLHSEEASLRHGAPLLQLHRLEAQRASVSFLA